MVRHASNTASFISGSKFRTALKPIVQLIQNPGRKSKGVFLVGCGRSGTNILVNSLEKLWDIQLYNENNPKAFVKWRFRELDVIESLISNSSARLVLFKPIMETYRTRALLNYFADSRFIYQVRHYDDVVNSILRGPFGTRKKTVKAWLDTDFREFSAYPPSKSTKSLIGSLYSDDLNDESGSALYWMVQNRFFIDQDLHSEARVLRVNYEDLVNSPENVFTDICNFIGCRYKKRLIRGISAGSIKKYKRPDLHPRVRSACDELWEMLSSIA